MITPEQLAKSGSERGHQTALFVWASQSGIDELKWMFAIPNGFFATPAQKAKMKAEGLKSGIADILLPVSNYVNGGNYGLFIEMKHTKYKTYKDGGLKPEQIEFGDFVTKQGYKFVVCYSWIEARDIILKYLGKV